MRTIRLSCLLLCLSALPLCADSTAQSLTQWRQWILDGQQPQVRCPHRNDGSKQVRQCIWGHSLDLALNDQQLTFTLSVTTAAKVWIQLPGSHQHWPAQVGDGNADLPIVPAPGRQANTPRYPGVVLNAGSHQLSGHIPLAGPLLSLPLPGHRGLVTLSHQGQAVEPVDIDRANTLWLQRQVTSTAAGSDDNNSASIKVFRKLTDSIPLTLETRLELSVSGTAREWVVGKILPPNTVLTGFESELPGRVDQHGILTMQVRAGKWPVTATARYLEQDTDFGFDSEGSIWPGQEVWSFAAQPQLRGVTLSGATSVDPSQLAVPAPWRQLPAFRLLSGQRLQLTERYRGEVTPAANQLMVNKTIWIDFDGQGATVRDHLQGRMRSGWRLSAAADSALGRASINGRPQVITRLPDGSIGVEIRQHDIALETVSRLENTNRFSASGWRQNVDQLSANVLLPPGWKIWHITGPDAVTDSWLSAWNLWDIFICLLIVAVVAKLMGVKWALLTVVLCALTYHDAKPVLGASALLLFAIGLLGVMPAHRIRTLLQGLCYALAALVVIMLLNFSVQAIRQALYPQLEYHHSINDEYAHSSGSYAAGGMSPQGSVRHSSAEVESLSHADSSDTYGPTPATARKQSKAPPPAPSPEPEHVQTGPGIPTWQWHRATLRWSGPVSAEEQLGLYVSGPLLNRLLRPLQVLLLLAFAGHLLRRLWQLRQAPPALSERATASGTHTAALITGVALLSLLGSLPLTTPPAAAETDYPPQFLLEEYQRRLLQPPQCGDACYAINKTHLIAREQHIELQLSLSSLALAGVPLPRFSPGWQPSSVLFDDQTAGKLFQQRGQWYLLTAPGVHQVSISGPLYSEEFTLEFDQANNVTVAAPEFEVSGLIGNRLQSKSLTLRRRLDHAQTAALFAEPIAPFVAVHRHLRFDQDWSITTTVARLAPATGPLNINVPLLDGETITVDGIEQRGAEVAVALGKRQQQFTWQSSIPPQAQYTLQRRSNNAIAEHWSLYASPRWRIDSSALATVKTIESGPIASAKQAQWHWRPLPGEHVTLHATQPSPVKGPNTTVEAAKWTYTPGDRSARAVLELRILSSIGQDYLIEPPPEATLEKLIIGGREQILPSSGADINLPLHPGLQQVSLHWRLNSAISAISRTPAVTLSSAPSNIDLTIELPLDRWPLLAGGPAIGPAVLFWSVLMVMVLVAVLLNQIIRRHHLSIPLRTWHWILLILGLSTVNAVGSLWVVAWFFALEAKGRYPAPSSRWRFNLTQLALIALTLISAAVLLATIPQSLLSFPDMQVQGNGSHNYLYRWYQDHSDSTLPEAWVFSLPIWVYRGAMLLWSLWLVFALMRWVSWGWTHYARHGGWRSRPPKAANISGDTERNATAPEP